MNTTLSGKTYVVTGATSGIGLAAAEMLVRQGAFVIGVGRSAARCREAENRLNRLAREAAETAPLLAMSTAVEAPAAEQVPPSSTATGLAIVEPAAAAGSAFCVADLSLQGQVRKLAEDIRALLAARGRAALDGLINNAGTFTYWLELTGEGFETQWAVNHLAPFLLTHELLPLLQAAPTARVVTVSSGSHYGSRLNWEDIQLRRHYNGLRAYGQSKLANVLFTQELNRRLGAQSSVRAFAADPGLVKTDIGLKGTPPLVRWVWQRRRAGGVQPEVSARGIVYLVIEPSIQGSPEIYWKSGKPLRASRQALDETAARRLWALSEQMCGISQMEEAVR